MAILKVIRPLKVNGEILQSGEMFRASNVQELIDRKYARYLTREETKNILNEYVRYAEGIFNKKEASRTPQTKYVQGTFNFKGGV